MADGVVMSENHQYLVDTSQPYAEVIQERAWATDGAGLSLDGIAQVYRYDIGLDRLHYFKYQMPINGPPSLGSPVLSEWLLSDGLGSTRALVGDSGSVVDEFGYNDAFGIPYRVTANGGGRAVAPPGFFLNGQQWDGGSGWGGAGTIWSGSPAFNSGEGLYFNRARYYQPGLGRFVGEDPDKGNLFEASTLHRYLYAGNDSVNHIDPSGEFTLSGTMQTALIANSLAMLSGGITNVAFDFTMSKLFSTTYSAQDALVSFGLGAVTEGAVVGIAGSFPYGYDTSGLAPFTGLKTRDSFRSRGFGLSALRPTTLSVILRGLPRGLFIKNRSKNI